MYRLVAVAASVALACGSTSSAPPRDAALPNSLNGMDMVQYSSGDEARTLIAHLHPGPLPPPQSEIGFYGSGNRRVVLAVSHFASADTAAAQLELTAAVIERQRMGFDNHSTTEIGGVAVHSTTARGRPHFFFARDDALVWLAADPDVASAALADVLGVPADSVGGS